MHYNSGLKGPRSYHTHGMEVEVCFDYELTMAKKELAERMGVMVQNLHFAFIWEHESNIYFSFQINEPGHSHNGSTLSININDMNRRC